MRTLIVVAVLFFAGGEALAVDCKRLSDPSYIEQLADRYGINQLEDAIRPCFRNPEPRSTQRQSPRTGHGNWIGGAYGWKNRDYTGGLRLFATYGHSTSKSAVEKAYSNCLNRGAHNCSRLGAFRGRCLSLARGDDDTYGGATEINEFGFGSADTLAAADRAAMEHCRLARNRDCRVQSSSLRKCR